MSAALHSLHPYSRSLHPPRNAIRTALIAASAGVAILLPAAVILWSF
jgi:hypothetical protein